MKKQIIFTHHKETSKISEKYLFFISVLPEKGLLLMVSCMDFLIV